MRGRLLFSWVDQLKVASGTPNLELCGYLRQRQHEDHEQEQQNQHASGPDQDFTQYVGLHQIVGVHVLTPKIDDQDAMAGPEVCLYRSS
jgi:hypothetical protein